MPATKPAQTVLITGCSSGIGHDLARRLARAGYMVIATARRPETLAGLPAALTLPLDVTDPASVAAAVAETVRRFGRLDVLVNNAGYGVRGALEEIPDAQVQAMFAVNVHGVLHLGDAVRDALFQCLYGTGGAPQRRRDAENERGRR